MSAEPRWQQELEGPTADFFPVFAGRIAEPGGVRDAVREAVKTLVPRIDWEAYQPHVPHGILGLRAVLRLKPLLAERSFLRALATQLHMAAHEGRRSGAEALAAAGTGSWRNLEAFIRARRPGLAYAEAQGFGRPEAADFQRLGELVATDMANVGHKAVLATDLADLHELLERPKATGRRLLGLAAWVAATPEDTFWARRAARRLAAAAVAVPWDPPGLDQERLAGQARDICDLGSWRCWTASRCFCERGRAPAMSWRPWSWRPRRSCWTPAATSKARPPGPSSTWPASRAAGPRIPGSGARPRPW